MDIKNILNEQFKDLITEDTLKIIEEAFSKAVEEKVQLQTENVKNALDETYTTKLTEALDYVDKDHTAKLKKLVETIDVDHTIKLQKLVKSIDKKHTAMLKQVVEKYDAEMKDKAESFQQNLVEEISNYLDLYIDKTIPAEQISEAVKNIKAASLLNQVRQIVGINEEFVNSEIKQALIDGKSTIDSLKNELNQTLKENADLSLRASKAEASILLEGKTSEMPVAKKNFIKKLLGNKKPEYIEENFSYVVEMFEKQTLDEVEEAQESIKKDIETSEKVDRPTIIEEKKEFTNNEIERKPLSEGVSDYLNEMKRISGSRFTK